MGTPYSNVIDCFTLMVGEHKLTVLAENERDDWISALMKTACSKFNPDCKKDLYARDDEEQVFDADLNDMEIDILCNYMIAEWLKPYLYSSELLRERLSTRDYSEYSPANLIDKINTVYNDSRKNARLLAINYTYVDRNYREKLREAISK